MRPRGFSFSSRWYCGILMFSCAVLPVSDPTYNPSSSQESLIHSTYLKYIHSDNNDHENVKITWQS